MLKRTKQKHAEVISGNESMFWLILSSNNKLAKTVHKHMNEFEMKLRLIRKDINTLFDVKSQSKRIEEEFQQSKQEILDEIPFFNRNEHI